MNLRTVFRRSWAFIRSVPISLHAIVIAAILTLGVKVFLLNGMPEIFVGAQAAGLIVEAVLASVLASYVFYLIVVHQKEFQDRLSVFPFAERHCRRIIGRCQGMINEFSQASGVELEFSSLTEIDLRRALMAINPNHDAPLIIGPGLRHAKWYQYPLDNVIITKRSIEKIYTQMNFLDGELMRVLAEIDDSHHVHFVESINSHAGEGIRNTDMTVFSSGLFQHVELCRKLEGLADRKLVI